jgi:aarF domain-containing kinase
MRALWIPWHTNRYLLFDSFRTRQHCYSKAAVNSKRVPNIAWWISGTAFIIGSAVIVYPYESSMLWGYEASMRSIRSIQTAIIMVLDYKWSLWKATQWYGSDPIQDGDILEDPYEKEKSIIHKRCAMRLLKLFSTNGGIYIKIGQHMASLDHLLPEEYCQTMTVLQNEAPIRSTMSDLEMIWKEEFPALEQGSSALYNTFDYIDPIPLGIASLAQVHKAHLRFPYFRKDGKKFEWVAVKIQHPNIRMHASMDMYIVEKAILTIKWLFPEFEFGWLAEEIRRNLPNELDFIQEAKNSERLGEFFNRDTDMYYRNAFIDGRIHIPAIIWPWTTDKILTMEYIEHGGKVNDMEYMNKNNISPNHVYKFVNQVFSRMIFCYGFVHADPHPGNLMIRSLDRDREPMWYKFLPSPLRPFSRFQLVIFDHGLYQILSEAFRKDYAQLWLALITGNENDIRVYSQKLGGGGAHRLFSNILTHRSWKAIAEGKIKQRWVETPEEIAVFKTKATQYVSQVVTLLAQLPRPLLLLFKINDLLRHIGRSLGQSDSMEMFRITWISCIQCIYSNGVLGHYSAINGLRAIVTRCITNIRFNVYYSLSYIWLEFQLFILRWL